MTDPDHTLLDQRIRKVLDSTVSGGGGGMDAWQQSVENRLSGIDQRLLGLRSQVEDSRRDLRVEIKTVLFGGIAAVVALAGLMARGFGWI